MQPAGHQSSSNLASRERRAAWMWGAFILGLMAINLGVAGMAVYMAVGDPSFKPLPNYSQEAIDWQARKDQQTASDRLGWTTIIERSTTPNGILVRIRDRSGQPISGGTGTLSAYHFTRVAEHRRVDLVERQGSPGEYFAPIDVSRDGRWQLSIEIDRAENEHFIEESQQNWESS